MSLELNKTDDKIVDICKQHLKIDITPDDINRSHIIGQRHYHLIVCFQFLSDCFQLSNRKFLSLVFRFFCEDPQWPRCTFICMVSYGA
jgi:anaerobic ribonucleoside-triphosphate reductase